jgi:hypothetical protein
LTQIISIKHKSSAHCLILTDQSSEHFFGHILLKLAGDLNNGKNEIPIFVFFLT